MLNWVILPQLTQLLIFSIFSRQTRPSSLKPARHTTATDYQIRTQIRPPHSNTQETIIRPDHPIRPSDQQITTATPDHQTRSHHRPQDAILDYSASNQHIKPNLLKWYRSGAFFMGWVEGGIKSSGWTLQSILSTHVRPEVFGHLFRLNLTVVRSVSGLPGLVRASPALFHKLGSFAGVRSAIKEFGF